VKNNGSADSDREIMQIGRMMKPSYFGQKETGQGDSKEVGTLDSHEQGMIIVLDSTSKNQRLVGVYCFCLCSPISNMTL